MQKIKLYKTLDPVVPLLAEADRKCDERLDVRVGR